MYKRQLLPIFLFCIILFSSFTGLAAENLVKNAGFEKVSGGMPENWNKDSWFVGESKFSVAEEDAHSGELCVRLQNKKENDARFEQTIKVKANTVYRFSAYIKAKADDDNKIGANISIKGTTFTSDSFIDTEGQWPVSYTHLDVYKRQGIS